MDLKSRDLPFTLRVDDIAALLKISRSGAYNLVKSKEFPCLKVGRRLIVPRDSFLAWLEANSLKK